MRELFVAGVEGGSQGEYNITISDDMGAVISHTCLKTLICNVFKAESRGVKSSSLLRVTNVEAQMIEAVEDSDIGLYISVSWDGVFTLS
jgi:hypothetical protein